MRKLIVSAIALLIAVLAIGPYFVGVLLQKHYQQLLAFYNSQPGIQISLTKYQRSWFTSSATLTVNVQQQNILRIPAAQFTIQQQIQHGPIILTRHISKIFNLTATQNNIILPAPLAANWRITRAETFTSYLGNHFIDLQLHHVLLPAAKIQLKKISLQMDVSRKGICGDVSFASLLLQNQNGDAVLLRGVKFAGVVAQGKDLFDWQGTLLVDSLRMDEKTFGPLLIDVDGKYFASAAFGNLLAAATEVARDGEVYQGQLRKKFLLILPTMITENSVIQLKKFVLETPLGNMNLHALVTWPHEDFSKFTNMRDVFMLANVQVDAVIGKKLVNSIMLFAADQPGLINDISLSDRLAIAQAREQMDWAVRQYNLFVGYIVDSDHVSENTGRILIDLQRTFMPMNQYAEKIKQMLLSKQISLLASYYLVWQYAQIENPDQFIENKVTTLQKSAYQKLQNQLRDFLQKGYIKENDSNYAVLFRWSAGDVSGI